MWQLNSSEVVRLQNWCILSGNAEDTENFWGSMVNMPVLCCIEKEVAKRSGGSDFWKQGVEGYIPFTKGSFSLPGKACLRVIIRLLRLITIHLIQEELCRFCPDFGTENQHCVFAWILQLTWECSNTVDICFVDLSKSDSSVLQNVSGEVLQQNCLPGMMLYTIWSLYLWRQRCVCIISIKLNIFLLGISLHQWCLLPSLIHNFHGLDSKMQPRSGQYRVWEVYIAPFFLADNVTVLGLKRW